MNASQFHRILLHMLLLPVLALAVVAGVLLWQVLSARSTVTDIQQADAMVGAVTRLQALVLDEETGLRGYQITADRRFLQPYTEAGAPLVQQFTLVRSGLQAQHVDLAALDAVAQDERVWQEGYARPLIALIRAGGRANDPSLNLLGKQQMDRLRTGLHELLIREEGQRAASVSRWHTEVSRTIAALLVLAAAAGILISVTTVRSMNRVSHVYGETLLHLRERGDAAFASEQRLRTTLTSMTDGVIVTDAANRIELLNTAAEDLTGYTAGNATGLRVEEVLPLRSESSRRPLEPLTRRILHSGAPLHLQEAGLLERTDGTELIIAASGAPILDQAGRITGAAMILRDLTGERQAQHVLVATEKLATAGRLAATIAHEMHNPLDSVASLLYLLQEDRNSEAAERYLTLAQAEVTRMGEVTRAMLGLYREATAPVRLDIRELLTGVLLLLEAQATKARVTLTHELPEGLILHGFPAELRQVFTNLITNAIDAASPGGAVSVLARPALPTRRVDGNSGVTEPGVRVTVTDNGVGIEATALPQLFEPFFTTKGENGTGLGLWVSRGIIDKHGGLIEIESRTAAVSPDWHGTEITVFLPRRGAALRAGAVADA